ncbi:HAD family hydrolase [Alcaligenes phenolicus]|uniref:phosphoglycolate phosphatase n=1 Tax=Alcaligenes phenolicus TaxID=232846 RepID=A0AAW5VZV2_9BURK|nr:HAD hydrolase-like protein [Alcaligenes phenolicus]MCX5565672.1 HAD hydrolase-like protein [Alcaligenes phenolicus]
MKQALSLHPLLAATDVQGLVFDLDGTIIDSATDIIHGMRLTFEQFGLGRLPDDYFPDNMHGTSAGMLRDVIVDMGWELPDDLTPLRAAYVEHYRGQHHKNTHLYPGVEDVLDACRDAGLSLAICTNKIHANAITALEKVGLNGVFDFVTGSDTWAQAKPSPLPLQETIRMLGLQPGQCLYFGDTSVDAICARDANVPFILHTSGYGDAALKSQSQLLAYAQWEELMA